MFEGRVIKNTINDIRRNSDYPYREQIADYDLTELKELMKDDKLVAYCLYKLSQTQLSINQFINDMKKMYTLTCIDETEESKKLFSRFIDLYCTMPEAFAYGNTSIYEKLYNSFDDKKIVYELYENIIHGNMFEVFDNINKLNLEKILSYPVKARQYYVSDRSLLSATLNFYRKKDISGYLYSELDAQDIVEEQLREDRKSCGIYDVDKVTLAEMDQKLDTLLNSITTLEELINRAGDTASSLKFETNVSKKELTNIKNNQIKALQIEASKVIGDFKTTHMQLVNDEKSSLEQEKESLLIELQKTLSQKEAEILALYRSLKEKISLNTQKISTTTASSIQQIEGFIKNNDDIKRIINETSADEEFAKKIDELSKIVEAQTKGKEVVVKEVSSGEKTESRIYVPELMIPQEERVVSYEPNFFLNQSIPFQKRYESFCKLKEEKAKTNGQLYHPKFDDVVKFIMQGETPYMYGPSGCGKTYMIETQLAELLGINVVTNGYILYEQDVIGYTNAGTGAYVPGNFYRCYKYGDVIFLDELDNGVANATVVLNRFLGKQNKQYTFPDGQVVRKNPNFRIVAAGNTSGNGRTAAYNTRQKLDESVQQRMKPIHVNYDNRIEEQILIDYPEWFDFAVNFRKAIESIPSDNGDEVNTMGTFTTRDAESVKESKDGNIFTDEQLMEYEIIQTKDIDTLTQIEKRMKSYAENGELTKGKQLLKTYTRLVNQKRDK